MTQGKQYDFDDRDSFEILNNEQIADGVCDDNPYHVLKVRGPDGTVGWVAGPHGTSCCALGDWLANVGAPARTRQQAISVGCGE